MGKWPAFWQRILSRETARFILALMALNFAAGSVILLMTGYADIDQDKEALINFALGQMFALAMLAMNSYFGRNNDEQASGKADDPVHIDPDHAPPTLPRDGFEEKRNAR